MDASSLSPYALYRSLRAELAAVYSPSEAAAVAEHYVCERLQLSRAQLLMDSPVALTAEKQSEIERDTQALREQVPVQYVLGYETFGSRRFTVSPDVLIPRPETYELVEWCASALSQQTTPRLLDVGTGSGCIAVSLALELPHARVEACDISPRALTVARHNAAQLGAQVDFREVDLLKVIEKQAAEQREYDLIVSNPPYIPAGEAPTMADNVVQHEPHTALFVPDHDPLLFYRALAVLATERLHPGGALLVETHTDFALATAELFAQHGLQSVEIRNDADDRPRMVKATRA